MSDEIRIGEKMVPVAELRPAGHVFGDNNKPRQKRPRKLIGLKNVPGDSKLSKMANLYRPQGEK